MYSPQKMGITKRNENNDGVVKKEVNFADTSDNSMAIRSVERDASTAAGSPPKSPRSPRSPRRNNKTRNWWFRHYRAKENSVKSKKGMRQTRRLENWNYLIDLSANEELGDLEIVDLAEPTISVFAELLVEQDKMNIWNDFINHTEEDQEKMLKGFLYPEESEDEMEDEGKVTDEGSTAGSSTESSSDWELVGDSRKVHPGYTAEQCFRRIDSGLRNVLKKKHLPLGALEHMEDEVTLFFKEWPTSVFISNLPSSYERLLMHALCQYLDLSSKSFNDEKGTRQTQVENKRDVFSPPVTTLWQYLESKH